MVQAKSGHFPYLFWDEIYSLIEERGLKEARRAYEERCRRPCTHKGIDAEIIKLFRNWAGDLDQNDNPVFSPTIAVPPELVLGLILREGSGVRTRGLLGPTWEKRQIAYRTALKANQEFKKLKAKLKTEYFAETDDRSSSARRAEKEALDIISRRFGLSREKIKRPRWRRNNPTRRA
jgi:hypothetical protein